MINLSDTGVAYDYLVRWYTDGGGVKSKVYELTPKKANEVRALRRSKKGLKPFCNILSVERLSPDGRRSEL